MPVFTYKALGSGGAVVTGELSAGDRGEALRQLDKKGLQPVKVAEASVAKKASPKSDAQKAAARRRPEASVKKTSPLMKPKGKNSVICLLLASNSSLLSVRWKLVKRRGALRKFRTGFGL